MSEKKLTESIEDDRGVLARRDGSGLPARRGALAHVSAEQIALADKDLHRRAGGVCQPRRVRGRE